MMNKSSNIKQELESISPFLAELDLVFPFQVPTGYFEKFPVQMLSVLKTAEIVYEADPAEEFSPDLKLDKSMPFVVPVSFFDNLAEDLLNKIKNKEETAEEELRNISPYLASIPKLNPYSLVDGYFETLRLPINKEDQLPKARVFVMETWKRLAAAAVFAGIIFTSLLFYFNQNSGDQTQALTNGTGMKPLSEKALTDFLAIDDLEILPVPLDENSNNSFALIDIDEKTIDELLQTIDDRAIKEFMNENPGAAISDKLN